MDVDLLCGRVSFLELPRLGVLGFQVRSYSDPTLRADGRQSSVIRSNYDHRFRLFDTGENFKNMTRTASVGDKTLPFVYKHSTLSRARVYMPVCFHCPLRKPRSIVYILTGRRRPAENLTRATDLHTTTLNLK